MVQKYPTAELVGLVLTQTVNGEYVPKMPVSRHSWRIGKHTKGKLDKSNQRGQLFFTEKNMPVALLEVRPLAFTDRHDFQPIARFTNKQIKLPSELDDPTVL